ncbi:MAG TPA: DUF4340 domain-containing protein [Pseudomonadales bacterium]|nr:DUF4340 domain-containing protein [Pseudomonadales bacterium]
MQMNQKSRLGLAAAIVAVMVLLVAVFGHRERPGTVAGVASPWLPQLQSQLGELRRLRLQSSAETVTLARGEAGWVVEERAAYPADFRQLETLLEALASARLLERKTARPEYFDRLGLVDIEQPASEAVQLELWSAGEQPVVRVLLGRAAEGRNGRYVRAVSEQQTWLIDTSPEPMTNPADWLERTLLDIDFSRVASVSRALGATPEFSATRTVAGDAPLALAALPAGKVPRYQGVFDAAARAILTAEPEDVRKAAELDFTGAAETVIGSFDGLNLTVRAIKAKDGNWVALGAAAGTPVPRAEAPASELASDEELTPETAGTDAIPGEAAAQAERLNRRLDGWAFKVSDYVYGELVKGLADYLQDEQPPAVAPGTPAQPPAAGQAGESRDE